MTKQIEAREKLFNDECLSNFHAIYQCNEKFINCPCCGNEYWPTCKASYEAGFKKAMSILLQEIDKRGEEVFQRLLYKMSKEVVESIHQDHYHMFTPLQIAWLEKHKAEILGGKG